MTPLPIGNTDCAIATLTDLTLNNTARLTALAAIQGYVRALEVVRDDMEQGGLYGWDMYTSDIEHLNSILDAHGRVL